MALILYIESLDQTEVWNYRLICLMDRVIWFQIQASKPDESDILPINKSTV
jgi:hypothetical protein